LQAETHLDALRRSSLEQVVQAAHHDDALAARVHLDTANLDAVLQGDVLRARERGIMRVSGDL
jgi:hypothetical protein